MHSVSLNVIASAGRRLSVIINTDLDISCCGRNSPRLSYSPHPIFSLVSKFIILATYLSLHHPLSSS